MPRQPMIEQIYLGLPIWNRADWNGELFPSGTASERRLSTYARFFNAVEGNTTFYATPPASTVARWKEQTTEDFRFCFKLPRTVTHDRLLVNARREADVFMQVLEPLGPRLGPVLVQLPPRFGPSSLTVLEDFLLGLPPVATYAVEVRHPDLFEGAAEDELNAMLIEQGVDRVIMDTRGVFEATGDNPALLEAQRKKPRLPTPVIASAMRPVVRYVANPDLPANEARFEQWSQTVAQWCAQGREPYVFMHVPNDFHAPRFARRFFEVLSEHMHAGTLPRWVGERHTPTQVGFSFGGEG